MNLDETEFAKEEFRKKWDKKYPNILKSWVKNWADYIIRKLSPVECERLQTLPDGYTDCVSNAQRYKCLGNGWTVDVIAHILYFLPNG